MLYLCALMLRFIVEEVTKQAFQNVSWAVRRRMHMQV